MIKHLIFDAALLLVLVNQSQIKREELLDIAESQYLNIKGKEYSEVLTSGTVRGRKTLQWTLQEMRNRKIAEPQKRGYYAPTPNTSVALEDTAGSILQELSLSEEATNEDAFIWGTPKLFADLKQIVDSATPDIFARQAQEIDQSNEADILKSLSFRVVEITTVTRLRIFETGEQVLLDTNSSLKELSYETPKKKKIVPASGAEEQKITLTSTFIQYGTLVFPPKSEIAQKLSGKKTITVIFKFDGTSIELPATTHLRSPGRLDGFVRMYRNNKFTPGTTFIAEYDAEARILHLEKESVPDA